VPAEDRKGSAKLPITKCQSRKKKKLVRQKELPCRGRGNHNDRYPIMTGRQDSHLFPCRPPAPRRYLSPSPLAFAEPHRMRPTLRCLLPIHSWPSFFFLPPARQLALLSYLGRRYFLFPRARSFVSSAVEPLWITTPAAPVRVERRGWCASDIVQPLIRVLENQMQWDEEQLLYGRGKPPDSTPATPAWGWGTQWPDRCG